jgi:hypothetical protein
MNRWAWKVGLRYKRGLIQFSQSTLDKVWAAAREEAHLLQELAW